MHLFFCDKNIRDQKGETVLIYKFCQGDLTLGIEQQENGTAYQIVRRCRCLDPEPEYLTIEASGFKTTQVAVARVRTIRHEQLRLGRAIRVP